MKNVLIVGLLVIVIVESGYIVMKRKSMSQPAMMRQSYGAGAPSSAAPTGMPSGAPKPMMATKGQKLSESPLAKYTYQIVPGPLSADATKAMVGFSVKTQALSDGSTQVDLTPKDSDDQYQRYVVKSGQMLYFVEMTPADDNASSDKDLNYRDDYGVITDANGIIQ